MTREEAHTLLEVMAIKLTGELADSERPVTERTKLLGKQLKAIDMAIEALSEPKTGEWIRNDNGTWSCSQCHSWIPCSERLPMMGDYVLTYRPIMGMRMIVDAYEGYYGEDDDEWYEGWIYGGDKVIAWMPLPESYKGGDDE